MFKELQFFYLASFLGNKHQSWSYGFFKENMCKCVWTALEPIDAQCKNNVDILRQLLHSLHIPKVSGVAWQQAQRWIEVLKWWHLKSREPNLCIRSDDDSALKHLKKRPQTQVAAAKLWSSFILNEFRLLGGGCLRPAFMYLWEQLEKLVIQTRPKFVKHDTFIQPWWSHCCISHQEVGVEVKVSQSF